MKKTISILTWLNRVLIAIFIVLICLGFTINKEMQIVALLFTIIIGVFQVIASLITLVFWNRIQGVAKISLTAYLILVLLYPFVFYIVDNFSSSIVYAKEEEVLISLAVFLALLITVVLELIKRSFKNINLK